MVTSEIGCFVMVLLPLTEVWVGGASKTMKQQATSSSTLTFLGLQKTELCKPRRHLDFRSEKGFPKWNLTSERGTGNGPSSGNLTSPAKGGSISGDR